MRDQRHAANDRTAAGWLSTLVVLLMPTLASAEAAPSDPLRDCRFTLRARQALQQDIVLATQPHLGVTVRSGTATLWGSVPSVELVRRAEKLVREVPGIFEVRNDILVESVNDPMVEFLRSPDPRRPAGGPERQWCGFANRPSAQLTGRADPSEAAPAPAPVNAVAQMPPIVIGAPQAEPAPGDLAGAIRRLREADGRFRGVQSDVTGGVVRLHGIVRRWEDLFDLAQSISRIGGVERVILQDVHTPNERR